MQGDIGEGSLQISVEATKIWSDGEHREMDRSVMDSLAVLRINPDPQKLEGESTEKLLGLVLAPCLMRLKPGWNPSVGPVEANAAYPELRQLLRDSLAAHEFRQIRCLAIFHPKPNLKLEKWRENQSTVTHNTFNDTPYLGTTDVSLWQYINYYFSPQSTSDNTPVYANCLAIVQSSGCGKTRTMDELSKKHFTIPMNLREDNSSGYPPADRQVRDFLKRDNDASANAIAFLQALFEETELVVRGFDRETLDGGEPKIAPRFREFMTKGQTAETQGPNRVNFYNRVVKKAGERSTSADVQNSKKEVSPTQQNSQNFVPVLALHKLLDTLQDGEGVETSPTPQGKTAKKRKLKSPPTASPQVLIMFDEAHSLTVEHGGHSKPIWSNYSELRRTLRGMNAYPLFSLFLSTVGEISQFSPSREFDKSGRIMDGRLHSIPPYIDFPFDLFAIKYNVEAGSDLSVVTSDEYIARLGRAMFGSRYRFGDKDAQDYIVSFAAAKLLNWPQPLDDLDGTLSYEQELAVLSQRLPLEYHDSNSLDSPEHRQIESHMRICFSVKAGFTHMRTLSGSEPLLAEAAYYVMQTKKMNVPGALRRILSGHFVNQGDRGEILVLLLLTMARDRAVGPPSSRGTPSAGRAFLVTDFLSALFRRPTGPSSEDHVDLLAGEGINPSNDVAGTPWTLSKILKTSRMHFNHFIKIHQHELIDRKFLVRYPARGAAILCGTCQKGVDIVLVFSAQNERMSVRNTSVWLIQGKLTMKHKETADWTLCDDMDPSTLGLFSSEDKGGVLPLDPGLDANMPLPIIRIVFALGSDGSCLKVRPMDGKPPKDPRFRTYDIWCSGLDPSILGPITDNDKDSWRSVRGFCEKWQADYKAETKGQSNIRRGVNAGAGVDDKHFDGWCE